MIDTGSAAACGTLQLPRRGYTGTSRMALATAVNPGITKIMLTKDACSVLGNEGNLLQLFLLD